MTATRAEGLLDGAQPADLPSVNDTHGSLGRTFVIGGGTLGFAMATQRALSFFATALAAKAAGPTEFGAYSLALSTAGMVASCTGLGVGITASRYLGQYARGSEAYRRVLQT